MNATVPVDASDLDRFRALITRRLGLQFEDARLGFLADVLRRRLETTGEGGPDYLARLQAGAAPEELGALAREVTVGETYFFRHAEQFRAFVEVALPERLRSAQASSRRLRILSAGCASGEEPFSLAIAVRDAMPEWADAVSILGVDINPAVLEKAAVGRFSPWVLRETPPDVRDRWFRSEGREFELDGRLRSAVAFETGNLADGESAVWRPHAIDIVFCRNVLMYFEPSSAQALVNRLARALQPGGYLFLGHAETLRGLSGAFHLRHTHGAFYYQVKDSAEPPRAEVEREMPRTRAARETPTLQAGAWASPGWIDAIRQSSERIRTLVESRAATERRPVGGFQGRTRGTSLVAALELLRVERFTDALAAMDVEAPEAGRDAEVLLLHAVLLTEVGQLDAAAGICAELLNINELDAEAHYLLALCREGAGDLASAAYHDRVAGHLDPGFAMAHLHLGVIARRMSDDQAARREFEQAVGLLGREDAARILMFGGGFTREALVALCRAELGRLGGRR